MMYAFPMSLVERTAVRAILLTPDKEVLLMRIRNPVTHMEFWICPGGGLQGAETFEEGLKRELKEELGLTRVEARHQVHRRHHTFNWKDQRISQGETFFIVGVEKFEPKITDEVEAEVLQEFRWWPLHELDATKYPITPRKLKQIVQGYLELGPPKGPLEVDVSVD